MDAIKLYAQLEKDFIQPSLSDDWARFMTPIDSFLTQNFKNRSMGLVCDHTKHINHVYTAVFPTNRVMQYILDKQRDNCLLFVHHPEVWDIQKPEAFQQMDTALLQQFKEKGISIYNLHVPLDNYSEYSTGVNLAKNLGIVIQKPFAMYYGGLCGVIGITRYKTISGLSRHFTAVLGHRTSCYRYGTNELKEKKVAVAAGGGNIVGVLEEIADNGINVLVTGISAKNEHSQKSHDFARNNRINILGGTHYSTEKFACQAMCRYFQKLGLTVDFIDDTPGLGDL